MKINYFNGMQVSDTKKFSHQIEDLIDDEWRNKASRLQSRRWKKIHDREMGYDSGHHKRGSHR